MALTLPGIEHLWHGFISILCVMCCFSSIGWVDRVYMLQFIFILDYNRQENIYFVKNEIVIETILC